MKKLMMVWLLVLLFPAFALGADGLYLGASAGFTFTQYRDLVGGLDPDSQWALDHGQKYSAAVGYELGEMGPGAVRVDLQVAFDKSERDLKAGTDTDLELVVFTLARKFHGTREITTVMLNGYYDFALNETVHPFVTLGVGYAMVEGSELRFTGEYTNFMDDDDNVFAYQVGAGVTLIDTETLALDITYRYYATQDFKILNMETDAGQHEGTFGFRYRF